MKKIKHFKSTNISDTQLWVESIRHMRISHCFYPGCKNKNIIKSHTLQNNGVISKLALKNQVCMPRVSRDSMGPLDKKMGLELRKVGKNIATTFTGFCKEHDDKLFADIEKTKWQINDKTAFLFTYRTICSELQTKQEFIKRIDYIVNKKFWKINNLPEYTQADYQLNKLAVSDLKRVKNQCDHYLEKSEDKEIPILGIALDMPQAKFAISGYYIPYYDFNGKLMNRRFGEVDFPVFVNIIPYGNKTIAFLTASRDDYEKFYKDFFAEINDLSLVKKEIFLTNISIKSSDNLVISPEAAKNLTRDQVKLIEGENNSDYVALETIAESGRLDLIDKGLNLFKI